MSWLYFEMSSLVAATIGLGCVLALLILGGLVFGYRMGRGL